MFRLIALVVLFALSFPAVRAMEATWPLPTPPAGSNPALFPVQRQDWLTHFQSNLDGSKGKTVDLIFDGDSITDFWLGRGKAVWDPHYGARHPFDFGIGGDKVENLLWRLQQGQAEGLHPKLIVLMIGTNNTYRDTADQIAEGIKAIVGVYLQRCPEAHLLLLGVFPRGAAASDPARAKIADINRQIAVLDDGKRVTYLDIGAKFLEPDGSISKEVMADFLHPTVKGYQIWADAIEPVIALYVPKP